MTMGNEKGMALPLVLGLIAVFFMLFAGILVMTAHEPRFANYDANYYTARFAAEAAAKQALKQVQVSVNNGVNPTTISGSFTNKKICNDSPIVLAATWAPDTTTTMPSRIRIRARGAVKGVTVAANIDLFLGDSPITYQGNIVDLITTGKYSHTDHNPASGVNKEVRWKITVPEDPLKPKSAVPNTNVSQVMFRDPNPEDGLELGYVASAKTVTPGGTGGYGIYYGMVGNADDMNAYVLQYDPGARDDQSRKYSTGGNYYAGKGTLLVKKVVFEKNQYTNSSTKFKTIYNSGPGAREVNSWTDATWDGSYPNNGTPPTKHKYPSGTDSRYYALPFQAPDAGEVLRVPLASEDDSAVNGTSLQTTMNNWLESQSKPRDFDITAPHRIRIKVEADTNGILLQKVYCDDNPNPILQFTDHSTGYAGTYKLAKTRTTGGPSFFNTCSGVRVWDPGVQVNFYNDTPRAVPQRIVWIK